MNYTFPSSFTTGESVTFTKQLADYPASEWTLTYKLRGPSVGLDVEATADGDDHLIVITAAQTATLVAGLWQFQAYATKDAEAVLVDQGQFTVKRGFTSANADDIIDGRSQAQKIVEAIDAMMAKTATLAQKRYQINNRELERYSLTELIALRTHYANIAARDALAERTRDGKGFFKTIHTRFTRPQ